MSPGRPSHLRQRKSAWALLLLGSCAAGTDPGPPGGGGSGEGGGGGIPTGHGGNSSTGASGGAGGSLGGAGGSAPVCTPPSGALDVPAVCSADVAPLDDFELVEKWSAIIQGGSTWGNAPLVANLTDDNLDGLIDLCDVPDVLVHGKGTDGQGWKLALYSGDNGQPHPFAPGAALSDVQPAIADLDEDGIPEIVSVDRDGFPVALRPDGTVVWTSGVRVFDPHPEAPWLLRQSAVAIHDLDGDGAPEILVGLSVLDADGQLVFKDPTQGEEFGVDPTIFYAWARPTVADLDGDGALEVLFGYVTYSADGAELWRLETTPGFAHPGDFDGDGAPEVLFTNSLGLWLLDAEGQVLWGPTRPPSEAEPARFGCWVHPIALVDMTADGTPEALINTCDQRFVAVIGPTGPTILAAEAVPITSAFGAPENGSTAFDFRGYGPDWLAHDHKDLTLFAGYGPEELARLPDDYIQDVAFPIVADVDNDGSADVVVVDMQEHRVRVYEDAERRHSPARRIWNQWNYWSSSVREDATIPSSPLMPWQGDGTFRAQVRRPCATEVPAE